MTAPAGSLHGVAFLLGETGLIVTGASGAGKSSFVLGLAAAWRADPVRLVADDRVRLALAGGRVVARPVEGFAGKVEIRGIGIADCAAMPSAVIRAVIALEPDHPPRMPPQDVESMDLMGVAVPLLRLRQGAEAIPAFITKWPCFHGSVISV